MQLKKSKKFIDLLLRDRIAGINFKRMNNIINCAEQVLENNIPGDFVETGVLRGGSVILMRSILQEANCKDRKVFACDSFKGLPPNRTDVDIKYNVNFQAMNLCVDIDTVKNNFKRYDLLDSQVEFIQGWFCDTLPKAPIEKIAILRLDGDMYESTKDALENLYHKVSKNGFVIIDDYGHWPQCRIAVDEFIKKHKITAKMIATDRSERFWKITQTPT